MFGTTIGPITSSAKVIKYHEASMYEKISVNEDRREQAKHPDKDKRVSYGNLQENEKPVKMDQR